MGEPDLPPLPSSRSELPRLSRKRTHQEFEINTSSDPALFSSDDYLAAAEDYSGKRHKKKWEGTWWGQRLGTTTTRRTSTRTFKRNYDSGIFMGSDGTDTSLDAFLADEAATEENAAKPPCASSPTSESHILSTIQHPLLNPAQPDRDSPGLYQARADIQRCLEEGAENVDLSHVVLTLLEVPELTVSPDYYLSRHCLPRFQR